MSPLTHRLPSLPRPKAFPRVAMKWARFPNLAARPAKPSLNRGPIQVRARRVLWALGVASTSQIDAWAHPRGRSRDRTNYTRRVLNRIAVKVGRASTRGSLFTSHITFNCISDRRLPGAMLD
jgi:hypothetical protein